MTNNLKRFGALTLVLAALILVVAACSASAATYSEYLCTGNVYTDAELDDTDTDDNWIGTSNDCPNGFSVRTQPDTTSAGPIGEFAVTESQSTFAVIQSVSLHVQRAPGIKLSIRACRFTTCGTATSTDLDLDADLTLSNENAGEIPDSAVTLKIYVECVEAVCPAYSGALVSNVVVTRRDDTAPFVQVFEANVVDGEAVALPEASKWNNDEIVWSQSWGDMESNLNYFRAGTEGVFRCYALWDPYMYFPVPECANSIQEEYLPVTASDLEDGYHEFVVTVVNRANLSSTDSFTFKTDATNPGQPFQFEVAPHFNDWQGSRDVRVDWTNPGETVETDTQSGIAGFSYDVAPKFGGNNEPTSSEDPPKVTVNEPNAHSVQLHLPSAGQWTVEIETFDRAGNVSTAGTASINIDDARLPAADVADIAPINIADKSTGRTIAWTPGAASVSGICSYDWAFAAIAGFNPGEDPSTPLLGNDAVELNLTPSQVQSLSERPQRFHLRGYSCAGVPGEIAHEPVIVDFTAPSVTISPASGNLAADDPVSISVQDAKPGTIQSGIASVTCVVGTTNYPCANGSQIRLPGGDNHLVVTATDIAGNSTTEQADLVVDSGPPTGWIEQSDPADPTLVRATVHDADTGVRSAELEYRPAAGGSWLKLGNGFRTESPSKGAVVLSARVPDGGELADGTYLLRVRATDATGAVSFIAVRTGGDSAGFSIPLRANAVLSAGLTASSKSKGDPPARLGVDYGQMPLIVGVLRRADGSPIGGAQLDIVADQSGSPIHTVASTTTRSDGAYSVRVPPGGSRRLIVRFGGSLVARATSAEAQLRVRGKVTLKASRSTVRSKKMVYLRGTVFARGATLPLLGKEVQLRFTIGGRRSSLVKTRRTDAAGRFEFSFSYKARRRPVRFTARVIAPVEPTWAFEAGESKAVKFVVRP